MTTLTSLLENNTIIALLVVLMFILSGIGKLYDFEMTVESLKNKVPLNLSQVFHELGIYIVILLEILAPIIIIYSVFTGLYKNEAYYSVIALIVFTIVATLIYHPPNFGSYKKSIPFLANVSLLGGLLLLAKMIKNE